MSTPDAQSSGTSRPEGSQAPRPSTSGVSSSAPKSPATAKRPGLQPKPTAAPAQNKSAARPEGAKAPVAGQTASKTVPAQAPAKAPTGQRPAAQQQKLVRPAPKAKVRKARLLVSKIDPWSVLKLSFLLSVALGIVTVVAAVVLWTVLDLTGVFDSVNSLLAEIAGSESSFSLADVASLGQIAAFATIVAVVNVLLITAISTLASVLYNISASLVGGIGVTLTDD